MFEDIHNESDREESGKIFLNDDLSNTYDNNYSAFKTELVISIVFAVISILMGVSMVFSFMGTGLAVALIVQAVLMSRRYRSNGTVLLMILAVASLIVNVLSVIALIVLGGNLDIFLKFKGFNTIPYNYDDDIIFSIGFLKRIAGV